MDERVEGMFQQAVRGLALIGLVGGLACGPDLLEPAVEASGTASEQSLEPDPVEHPNDEVPVVRLRLTPQDPVPGDLILPEITVENADEEEVSLTYIWRVDGERVATGDSYKISERTSDTLIELQVIAHAGHYSSDPVTAYVRVGNRAPSISSIALQPSLTPTILDEIKAIPRGEDPDGDPIDFIYHWSVNGSRIDYLGPELPKMRFRRGDKIDLDVVATDGNLDSEPMSAPTIVIVNAEPVIVSVPTEMNENGTFQYNVVVEDADDRMLRYALLEKPDGMTIDWLGGAVQWKPTDKQAGKHTVKLEVDDQNGGKTTQVFTLDVTIEEPPKKAGGQAREGDDPQPIASLDSGADTDPDLDEDRDEYADYDRFEEAEDDRFEEAEDDRFKEAEDDRFKEAEDAGFQAAEDDRFEEQAEAEYE